MRQNIQAVLHSACGACFLRRKGLRLACLAADNRTGWGAMEVNAHLVLQAYCFMHVLTVCAKVESWHPTQGSPGALDQVVRAHS